MVERLTAKSRNNPESLDLIAKSSGFDNNLSREVAEYFANLAIKHAVGQNWLELGPAEGWGTRILSLQERKLSVVEGSRFLSQKLAVEFPLVEIHNMMFEQFCSGPTFDTVFASHVLEHVENPRSILLSIRNWMKDSTSRLIVSVPNSESVHRQIGVQMKIIESTKTLTNSDILVGHRRVYDVGELGALLEECGFSILISSGFFLKPLSANQLVELEKDVIQALFDAGELFPEIAADLFVVATKG